MITVALDRQLAIQRFHALSDPTRLEIVHRLRNGERCVCDLQDLLEAAQSRLSFHLKVLKESEIVTDRREGRWVYYTLNREALAEMEEFLEHLKPTRHTSPANSKACCT